MKLFLLIGQSNMAGRGEFGEVPEIRDPRCKMMRNGRLQPMTEPVCFDRSVVRGGKLIDQGVHSGVGLSSSFAKRYAEQFDEEVCLIPCADGGTSLKDWEVGGPLYDHAVMQTRLAMRHGELAGILWHQGEAESGNPERASSYARRFGVIIEQMQADLGVQVPLVLGELGEYLVNYKEGSLRYFGIVNEQLHAYADTHPLCAVASAAGLPPKADGLHFCSASLRTFGERYFEAYMSIVGKA